MNTFKRIAELLDIGGAASAARVGHKHQGHKHQEPEAKLDTAPSPASPFDAPEDWPLMYEERQIVTTATVAPYDCSYAALRPFAKRGR